METNTQNKIEKRVEIKAPLSKVWNAISDYKKFGEWFCVKVEGPFVVGEMSKGNITYPGYEHVEWQAVIQKIEPEKYFSYTWHPYAVDPKVDYSDEVPTLVEFKLEEIDGGTLLTVTESGFDKIPQRRQLEAFRMNDGGWTEQIQNIKNYVTK